MSNLSYPLPTWGYWCQAVDVERLILSLEGHTHWHLMFHPSQKWLEPPILPTANYKQFIHFSEPGGNVQHLWPAVGFSLLFVCLFGLLFYVPGSQRLWSCWESQLTCPRFSWAGLDLTSTVNFLNIRTPKKIVVITLKFELYGSTIE